MRPGVLVVLAMAAAMSACSDGGDSPEPAPREGLANGFAMVLADAPPPCPADPAMQLDQDEEHCYALETEALVPMADVLESAEVQVSPTSGDEWQVHLTLTESGIERFNELAASCFATDVRCPAGLIAITAGGDVVSAPQVQEAAYERDQIVVSGGFSEDEARQLADAFDPGADA